MVFLACYVYSLTELLDEVLFLSYVSFYICLLNSYLHKTQHCQPVFILFFTLSPFSLGVNFLSYFTNRYLVFAIAKITPGQNGISLAFAKRLLRVQTKLFFGR